MDKKGNPTYLRLPLSLEAAVQTQSLKEGRSKNEMIIHLIARGLHFSSFNIEDYCTLFFDLEGQNCREKP
jgi:hypothetical protein